MKRYAFRGPSLVILSAFLGISTCFSASTPRVGYVPIRIEAQPIDRALNAWAQQTGYSVLLPSQRIAKEASIVALDGRYTAEQALRLILDTSGLAYEFVNAHTVSVSDEQRVGGAHLPGNQSISTMAELDVGASSLDGTVRSSEEGESRRVRDDHDTGKNRVDDRGPTRGLPEVLVRGSKSLNTDIQRTADDTQPYVVMSRKLIETSGASNLEELFRDHLTMDASTRTAQQVVGLPGVSSDINLRGLGSDETLILVDGRRVAGIGNDNAVAQADINSIPLSAIERIEILPTTASGIYGGSATGGVVNIILRRDYTGFETTLSYGNTFDSDVTSRRLDLNGGINLDSGRTSILMSASYWDSNPLLNSERTFAQRGRERLLENNPTFFSDASTPPLGRTTNICSATEVFLGSPEFGGFCDGQALVLKNGTPLGSSIAHVPASYGGQASDNGAAFLTTAGQYNLAFADTAQDDNGARKALLTSPLSKSALLTVRREFTPNIRGFVEGQASNKSTEPAYNLVDLTGVVLPSTAPNNPFQQDIMVTVPSVGADSANTSRMQTRRAAAGLIVQLPKDWQIAGDFTWSRSKLEYLTPGSAAPATLSAIQSGSLDVLRDTGAFPVSFATTPYSDQHLPSHTTMKDSNLRIGGPLPWQLPGGAMILSALVEHRGETAGEYATSQYSNFDGTFSSILTPSRSQSVNSLYTELRVPLVSAKNRVPAVETLELQIAGRRDKYQVDTAGTLLDPSAPVDRVKSRSMSTDPTLGLRYQPVSDLTLRASYGTGFRPPSLGELNSFPPIPVDFYPILGITDPLRGNELVGATNPVTLLLGGNANLRPEKSVSRSAGIILTPRTVPGLRVSADWSRINKTDNITGADIFSQQGIDNLSAFAPDRVTRGAPSGGFSVGPIIGLDGTSVNLSTLKVEALDLTLGYQLQTAQAGALTFSVTGTHNLNTESQTAPGAPVDKGDGALDRGNATLDWSNGGWVVGWRMRYFASYYLNGTHTLVQNQGSATVPSQTYHDVFGRYRVPSSSHLLSGALSGTEVQLVINNVFNTLPPVDIVNNLSLSYSSVGDPRLANYQLSVTKRFGGDR